MGAETLEGSLQKFTNRIDQRNVFMDVYINEYLKYFKDQLYDKKIKVINYYGVGGAGKSSLLQKIISDLNNYYSEEKKKLKNPVYAYYDFESGPSEVNEILSALVKNIKENYGNAFKFRRFDEAYKIYMNKQKSIQIYEDGGIMDRHLSLKMADSALGLFTGISTVGSIVAVADTISSVGKSFSKFKKELQGADVKTLLFNMPSYFVEDMKENLEEAEIPLVIFLDTYEKYIDTAEKSEDITTRDKWLYQENNFLGEEGIIHKLPDILWVIAGREELRWGVEEDGWLKKREVTNFDRPYTMEFLDKYNITDPQIREHIFDTTKGNPFYLRICAAIHEHVSARNQAIRLEDFNPDSKGNKEILVERFVRYFKNEQQEEMVYRLSCFDGWDQPLLDYAVKKELGADVVLDKLMKFSFISHRKVQGSDGGKFERYNMHQTMRKIIHAACPQKIREEMHSKIREYYAAYLTDNDTFSSDYIHGLIVYLNDCLEYLNYEDCLEAFRTYALPAFEKFWKALRHQDAYNIADDFLKKAAIKYPDTVLHAQSLILVADCTYRLGKVIAIKEYLEDAMRLLDKNDMQDSLLALQTRGKILPYYISFKDYSAAGACAGKIYEQLKEQHTDKHIETLLAQKRYAVILMHQERNIDGTLLSIKHLTEAYQGLSELCSPDDPQVISAYIELLNAKRFLPNPNFSELFAETEQMYKNCTEVLSADNLLTIRAKGLTCLYASLVKDYPLAISRKTEILEFYQKNLGPTHTITVNVMMDLANYYNQWGKPDDYEQIIDSIPLSGLMEQDRWPILFLRVEKLINHHELAKAKEIYTALLEEIRTNLQEDHVQIITYTNKLINRLCKSSYYEEALELFDTISRMDTAGESLLKLLRACDEPNRPCDNYEELCNKLESLIEEQSRLKGERMIFWLCRQNLSNIMMTAKLEDRAYQLRQQLWNYDLTNVMKKHKYADDYRKLLYNVKSLKNKTLDPMDKITQYQNFYKFLKEKVMQNCIRHKQIYTLMNNSAQEYQLLGKPNEFLFMKLLMYDQVFRVFGPRDKTCRFIMAEMQKLAYEEGWRDWSNYLKSIKEKQEEAYFILCKECSRVLPVTVAVCYCGKELGIVNE